MNEVKLMIDEATVLIIGGKEYSGEVIVNPDTAKQLLDTKRASVLIFTQEVADGSARNA
ncbi:MAG: hypothetical protein M0P91_05230 [Sulfuricurvum sp.]|jgi:hypothetical protein|uniref:hypothetical protein n=1 Tax=Sulfuricurvum sp. TaxID=2025608 RepID=UPI0025EE0B5B|nr:hypothetical protein [Sulfuricurvum sp.]MCK9372578.1 hypothetical protein [Sulfuricurvum sp.]